jgi:starch synthase
VAPFSKTGGLGDVAGALPSHLAKGADVIVIAPRYKGSLGGHASSITVQVPIRDTMETVTFETALIGSVPVYLVVHPYFDRDTYYGHADDCERFVLFCRAALELLTALKFSPDIIHLHDWQTALVPIYLKTLYAGRFPRTRSVLTIHNMAFQGLFWHWDLPVTGLDWALFNPRQLEFWSHLNLLKGGLIFADAITTVSPTYAKEICTPAQGWRLEGVLQDRRNTLTGILNGIDTKTWNPETDKSLPARFSPRVMKNKAVCKAHVQKKLALAPSKGPLFAFIGRLAEQKGVDLLIAAMPEIVSRGAQVVILGAGSGYRDRLELLASDGVAVRFGLDEVLAHELQGGADFLLMPSLYEPCGLSQLYALRYGTIPIVRRTGGLADTVRHDTTGILFEDYGLEALLAAIDQAFAIYRDAKRLKAMRAAAMAEDFGWSISAKKYLDLFRRLAT